MRNDRLLEVWNDTVDSHHLIGSLIIGITVSLGTFWMANAVLTWLIDDPEMARTYAMLCGIIGCVIGGTICARLFRPKRQVSEDVVDSSALQDVLATLHADYGGSGTLDDLPESIRAELRELDLEDAYRTFEQRAKSSTTCESTVYRVADESGSGGARS